MPTATTRLAYVFSPGHTDGDGAMRDLLGGKGALLADLTRAGLPVPPGFTLPTTAATDFVPAPSPAGRAAVADALRRVEAADGRRFGDPADPLLLAVRSGAAVSMPGMMETVLNVGLTDATVHGLAAAHDSDVFAFDCYCRLVAMSAVAVAGADRAAFDAAWRAAGLSFDVEATLPQLLDVLAAYKTLYARAAGQAFPQDPVAQLTHAITAVYASARSPRAAAYRAARGLADGGTAVTVQAMVFGNLDNASGTGVAFTRDPRTGEAVLCGEFLVNAQGEDLVAGRTKPYDVATQLAEWNADVAAELRSWRTTLEARYRDVQDFEFTVERGRPYLLQTRTAQRTAAAAVRVAVEMAEAGLIDRRAALLRIDPPALADLLRPTLDVPAGTVPLATGLAASPGVAVGAPAFTADEAASRVAAGEAVILVRPETDTADVAGMTAAAGVLTATGGWSSHAAYVARGIGRPCVVGVETMRPDPAARTVTFAAPAGDRTFGRADVLSVDGDTGHVYAGRLPTAARVAGPHVATLLAWADAVLDADRPAGAADRLRAAQERVSARPAE